MKILNVNNLKIPEIKIIKFARFKDQRGYFTEHFRKSDFLNCRELNFSKKTDFPQSNESFSKKGVIRGLHFQWNPYMGKLVRTINGRMIDMALDIRKGSPNFGKIILYDMPKEFNDDFSEWIWVPPGFAHGNFFPKDTVIEYFCTGEYNSRCEAGISPLAHDIDWSLCDKKLKILFDKISLSSTLISEKDKSGFTISQWKKEKVSGKFTYK